MLSSAGAGAKADPTRLHVLDISESSCDALAKALRHRCVRGQRGHVFEKPCCILNACVVRINLPVICVSPGCDHACPVITVSTSPPTRRLRRDHGIEKGVPVLLSTEKPRCKLVAGSEEVLANPLDYQVRTDVTVLVSVICL